MDLWGLQLFPDSQPGGSWIQSPATEDDKILDNKLLDKSQPNIHQRFIVGIPEGFPLEAAGPVFCAGIILILHIYF